MYFDSIREVISLGGDTDTNACIVGGIIGSYLGVKNISEELLANYFRYDNVPDKFEAGKGRPRAEWLNMGRNTVDACFWLHILRYRDYGSNNGNAKLE